MSLGCYYVAVYPRWRGEHNVGYSIFNTVLGLSPLARGTPLSTPISLATLRFIPAGAGNTATSVRDLAFTAVYPRWRGEHIKQGVTLKT